MLYKLFTLFCGCWSSTKCKYFKLSCKGPEGDAAYVEVAHRNTASDNGSAYTS